MNDTQTRREFIRKAGRFAVYTPPAVYMLMHPSRDSIAKSAGGSTPSNDRATFADWFNKPEPAPRKPSMWDAWLKMDEGRVISPIVPYR